MKKIYDETNLTKKDFPGYHDHKNYPDYIVFPISKLKRFNINFNNIAEAEPKIKIALSNIKDYLNEDYLIIFQNIGINEKPIYKELITEIDFWLAFGDVYENLETVKFILDLAKKNPLIINEIDGYYELDENAKIEFGLKTYPNIEKVKKIINALKKESRESLKYYLELNIQKIQETAEIENAIRNTDEFIKRKTHKN